MSIQDGNTLFAEATIPELELNKETLQDLEVDGSQVKGGAAYVTVDFTPGDYAFVCFLPDAKDGKPHFEHGMVKQVHVE